MSSMAAADLVTPPETQPGQVPARPRPTPAGPPAPAQRDGLRPLEVNRCSMCGVELPLGLLVPDGGPACDDVRWYCKDARSCTERWTAARPPQVPVISGPAADAAPPAAGTARAEQPVSPPENPPDRTRRRVRAPQ